MKKITIKDIAKEVGVSVSTVSNVINGKDNKVSNDTLQRIHKCIRDLNYIPNLSARSLVNNKSKLIGVIIPQTEDYKQLLLENPFYSEIVSGIESKIREQGYYMILTGVDKDKSFNDIFVKWNLDGAIIMGIYKERFYEELKKVRIPIILVDSYINDDYFYKISIDDEMGGYLATKYLLDSGHRNIAHVTGSIKKGGVTEKRFSGYKKALKEANIFYNSEYVFEESMSYEHGFEAGKVIGKDFDDITAVFASADLIAAGVISGLKVSGKEVPIDLSVIGFDNISVSRMLIPSLTTVNQNISIRGNVIAEKIINIVEGIEENLFKEITMPLEIIERNSVTTKSK